MLKNSSLSGKYKAIGKGRIPQERHILSAEEQMVK